MSTYLGIAVKKGLQISPLRNDKKPTACFWRNGKGELIFHDFGIGFNQNFIGVVMYINQCNYQKALQNQEWVVKHMKFGLIKQLLKGKRKGWMVW